MRKKDDKCQGCGVIFDTSESKNIKKWKNPLTGKVEDMTFCDYCKERRDLGIPIEGFLAQKNIKVED